jgi:hypothetical protein
MESGGRNVYAFVVNSPLTSIDRDGRFRIGGVGVGTNCGGWNVVWYFITDISTPLMAMSRASTCARTTLARPANGPAERVSMIR